MRHIIILFIIGLVFFTGCSDSNKEPYSEVNTQVSHPSYVGAETCKECHQEEHADWKIRPLLLHAIGYKRIRKSRF